MQSVRDVLRQSFRSKGEQTWKIDAVRAGCAEAKDFVNILDGVGQNAIRAGCSETNGRSLYSNDHAQNNEVNRKES